MSQITPSQQRSNSFDEKEHYTSLISLFKYSVTFVSSIFAFIGILIGFLTYQNGKDMRDDLKAERLELKQNVQEMKSDLKNQEIELRTREERAFKRIEILQADVKSEVENTKITALNQIGMTKQESINQAKDKITEIFKDKNLEGYVEDVAKEKMERKINEIIDSKFEDVKQQKIETAIVNLSSNDYLVRIKALTSLQLNTDIKLNREQTEQLIRIAELEKEQSIRGSLYNILILTESSDFVRDFFQKQLLKNPNEPFIQVTTLSYLSRPDIKFDLQFYCDIVNDNVDVYSFSLQQAVYYKNKSLITKLLNSEKIINILHNKLSLSQLDNLKVSVKQTVTKIITEKEIEESMLFLPKK